MKPKAFLKDDFKDILEYQKWLEKSWKNLSQLNRHFIPNYEKTQVERTLYSDSSWYGRDVTYKELAEGVKEYKNPALLDEIYAKVNHNITPEISQALKSRKLKFNALGLGVFCFDRASMTMYRNKEFYSPSKKIKIESDQVKNMPKGLVHKTDNSKVVERWEQKPDGSPKIRTHTKELFAYFPQPPRDRHAAEFFISCDAPGSTNARNMLYSGVSAVIMAELLMKAGIKVKINIVNGSALSSLRDNYIGCVVPVKQYDETLDRNLVALLTSDPRFMRYDAFKGVITAFDHFMMPCPSGMGLPMDAQQLKTLLEDSGYTEKSKAQHRYYFGGTFSEDAAIADIEKTIRDMSENLKAK